MQEDLTQKIQAFTWSELDVQEASTAPFPKLSGSDSPLTTQTMVRLSRMTRFWKSEGETSLEESVRDLVVALYGQRCRWSFLLRGSPKGVTCWFGAGTERAGIAKEAVQSLLLSSFPDARVQPDTLPALEFKHAGLIVGTPSPRVPRPQERSAGQIERLCRKLYGHDWAYLVLARPVRRDRITAGLNRVNRMIEEVSQPFKMRESQFSSITRSGEECLEILNALRMKFEKGRALGMWETRVHLLANDEALLGGGLGVLQAVFSGEQSVPDPVRALYCSSQPSFAAEKLTPLNSAEVSILACPPREQYSGYEVLEHARFGVESPDAGNTRVVRIGRVYDRGVPTGNQLSIPLDDLSKHAIIVGVPGSGKTNTCFGLLAQIAQQGIPFLVIEPAKSEYRQLIDDPNFKVKPTVITVGLEKVAPLRLNPFEVPAGIPVQSHIGYLKSLFSAAFVLYPPMPYVLDLAIQEVYEDRGWNLVRDQNMRAGGYTGPRLFPTLDDVADKVRVVIDRMNYDERIRMDVTAGLIARLDQLRSGGGNGPMLNTRHSISSEELFGRPTILELKEIVNDDEKAFLMGLILIRIYEHREAQAMQQGSDGRLHHVTLIEEAHRLLRNVSTEQGSEVTANPKGRAIEVFANILAEIRAYGEGFVIAEQIPSKLAPESIKNTNFKLIHRLLAEDDRKLIGSTMSLDPSQTAYLTRLRPGFGIAHAESMAAPALVDVPLAPTKKSNSLVANEKLIRPAPSGCNGEAQLARRLQQNSPTLRLAFQRLFQVVRLEAAPLSAVREARLEFESCCYRLMAATHDAERGRLFAQLADAEIEAIGRGLNWDYQLTDGIIAAFSNAADLVFSQAIFADQRSSKGAGSNGGKGTWDHMEIARRRMAELSRRQPNQLPYAGCKACSRPCQYRFHGPREFGQASLDLFDDAYEQFDAAAMADAALNAVWSPFEYAPASERQGAALCFAIRRLGESSLPPRLQVVHCERVREELVQLTGKLEQKA